jgi:hypothetical protein
MPVFERGGLFTMPQEHSPRVTYRAALNAAIKATAFRRLG